MVAIQTNRFRLVTQNSMAGQLPLNKIDHWHPHQDFNATSAEILHVHNTIRVIDWSKKTFHSYVKSIETLLLGNFRDVINKCHTNKTTIPPCWIEHTSYQWRMLALVRDFHDHMCGRDQTHYIRTDDCRRFLTCVLRGLHLKSFPKPVHRLLGGENAPRKFIHPRFIRFNSRQFDRL